jgi:hypothetical protein
VPFVRVKRRAPFEYIDELVLLGVSMTKRRDGTRTEASEVHSEVGDPEEVSEWMLLTPVHSGCERLRVV